jgi:hypothetical protein
MSKRPRLETANLLTIPKDVLRMVVDTLIYSHEGKSALALMGTCTALRALRPAHQVFDVLCLDAWLSGGAGGGLVVPASAVRARMVHSILAGTARWFESGEAFQKHARFGDWCLVVCLWCV